MTGAVEQFQADFERLNQGEAPAWLKSYRQKAMQRFRELGLPDTRKENWRYTNLRPLAEKSFAVAGAPPLFETKALDAFRLASAVELVFIDGKFAPHLSRITTISGLTLKSLSEIMRGEQLLVDSPSDRHAFTALNAAMVTDGAYLRISAGASVEIPVHLLYYATSDSAASHPRNVVVVDSRASATLVETFAGSENLAYLTNAVTEIRLGENAALHHIQIQDASVPSFHFSRTLVAQAKNSRFRSHVIQFGGRLTRNELDVRLEGENAECSLDGLFIVGGEGHVDNYTMVDHLLPHGSSQELYKGILGGKAVGVFNGRVVVEKDAQKTDARQTNKNLLLTDEATINTKPQLEIYADDVKCTHGATIGQLEEEALFYLRSRGIGEIEARDILTFAFASDILSRLPGESLRLHLGQRLRSGFARLGPDDRKETT